MKASENNITEAERNIEKEKEFIRNRITSLRLDANISEYQMSLELGQNKGYIQSISSGRALPSMAGFLNICDYFNITPLEFFDDKMAKPYIIQDIGKKLKSFSEDDLIMLNDVLERILLKCGIE